MHQLIDKTKVNAQLEEVWDFFSSPHNLKKISPEYMDFTITNGGEGTMYPGQIISYRVKPILGIPMTWVTEITHVREKQFFVDEQRIGPYTMWHHEHHFREVEGGVEMTDIVSYKLPLGLLGRLAHLLFVKRQLEGIFNYREKVIKHYFQTA